MREIAAFQNRPSSRLAYEEGVSRVFSEHLVRNGLRLTGQRREILRCLLRADRHLSQEDIFRQVRASGIGRATVFRTLKTLQECGLASPIVGSGGAPLFEINRGRPHHDHLICVSCGAIREIRWPDLEKIQERACRRIGFEPRWHRHEVFGLCRDCAAKAR